jgi:hypothetical protein
MKQIEDLPVLVSPSFLCVFAFLPSFLLVYFHPYSACDSSVGIALATGWTIGVLGSDSRPGLGNFLFTTASRAALEPTQTPIQWVPGALSLGIKRQGREADRSPPPCAEVKECVELYLHSPNTPSWRGTQLKKAQENLYLCLILHT